MTEQVEPLLRSSQNLLQGEEVRGEEARHSTQHPLEKVRMIRNATKLAVVIG